MTRLVSNILDKLYAVDLSAIYGRAQGCIQGFLPRSSEGKGLLAIHVLQHLILNIYEFLKDFRSISLLHLFGNLAILPFVVYYLQDDL